MILHCVIIDDEPLARECLTNYVREVDFLCSVGTGNNPVVLTRLLDEHSVDLIFLDIQMPILSGIDFLRITDGLPPVIITTAFPSYALEGFQLNVLDYLLKPVTFNRFFRAVTKAKDHHLLRRQSTPSPTPDYCFIKCDSRYERIYFDEILYVQAMQNYVIIQTIQNKYVTLLYLKEVEEKLDQQFFLRVHKSYVVAVDKVDAIEHHELLIQSFRIPISRNYRDQVMARVMNNRLWKR